MHPNCPLAVEVVSEAPKEESKFSPACCLVGQRNIEYKGGRGELVAGLASLTC